MISSELLDVSMNLVKTLAPLLRLDTLGFQYTFQFVGNDQDFFDDNTFNECVISVPYCNAKLNIYKELATNKSWICQYEGYEDPCDNRKKYFETPVSDVDLIARRINPVLDRLRGNKT